MNESYEFIGEKDEAVGKLIAGLPRVEAPGDFDMRVRARIAAGRPAGTSWLTPLVRVAVPAALLLALGGYFGYNALYQHIPTPVAGVRSTDPELVSNVVEDGAVKPTGQQMSDAIAKQPTKDQMDDRINISPNATEPSMEKRRKSGTKAGKSVGGTYDEDLALREGRRFLPRGLSTNTQTVRNVNASAGTAPISAKDVLKTIGITANYSSATWNVGSVTPNSLADKVGVKAGDVVEAVNDKTLTEKTEFGRTFSGTSLRVRRDGRTIKIDLKP